MTDEVCKWRDDVPCQFPVGKLHKTDGRRYCVYHMPLGGRDREKAELNKLLASERNLRGVQFPAGIYRLPDNENYKTSLEDCVFADGVDIRLARGTTVFTNAKFLGRATLRNANLSTAMLERVVVDGVFEVDTSEVHPASNWSLAGSRFNGAVNLSRARFVESLDLSGTVFAAPVQFDGTTFPQQTTGHGLQVVAAAIDKICEGSYRAARVQFSEHHNRDLQGTFYTLEKRCQRKGLPKVSVVRIVSRIYDEAAEYGYDYVHVLKVFLLVQVLAFLAYWFGLPGTQDIDTARLKSVGKFTVAQLAKPFELFSAREATSTIYTDVLAQAAPSLSLLAITLVHSLLSLILIALFILALRWRFRRD